MLNVLLVIEVLTLVTVAVSLVLLLTLQPKGAPNEPLVKRPIFKPQTKKKAPIAMSDEKLWAKEQKELGREVPI